MTTTMPETKAMRKCADCRFFIGGKECRRYAPRSGLGYLAYQFNDVLTNVPLFMKGAA
jgi:hypothetical protein